MINQVIRDTERASLRVWILYTSEGKGEREEEGWGPDSGSVQGIRKGDETRERRKTGRKRRKDSVTSKIVG